MDSWVKFVDATAKIARGRQDSTHVAERVALAHQPRTYATPKWAIPSAQRNADFIWLGQPGGNRWVQKLWAIQTVIAQVVPGSKGSTNGQKRLSFPQTSSGQSHADTRGWSASGKPSW